MRIAARLAILLVLLVLELRPNTCAFCADDTWCRETKGGPMCRGCHAERYFERILFGPIGLRFIGWQREYIRAIYGTVDPATGERVFSTAYGEIPKKNGKSFLVGGAPIYHLLGEGVDRPHAYGAAAAREQAGIVYRAAAQMVRGNPKLLDLLKINESTKRIVRRDGAGFYAVLSADGGLQDGVEPSLNVFDELHRWKGARADALYDVLTAGQISRREPLTIAITTAGDVYDSPICWRLHQRAQLAQSGTVQDRGFYSMMFGAAEAKLKADPEYWTSREARVEANPSHEDRGGFLRDAAILRMQESLAPASYKRYHLNIWGEKAEAWIAPDKWHACRAEPKSMSKRRCWIGVDLSKTMDLTAIVAVLLDGEYVDVIPRYWFPRESMHEAVKHLPVPLGDWGARGLVRICDGPTVDYTAVLKQIDEFAELAKIQEVCYDPYNASHFAAELDQRGYTTVEIRQGPRTLSAPMRWLEGKVLEGKVRHGGNEVLAWNVACTSTRADANGNIAPQKKNLDREGKRIDGVAAMLNAVTRAMQPTVKDPYSSGVRLMSI